VNRDANTEKNVATALYRQLLYLRRVEEAIADRYAGQKMRCPVHLSIGQEAVAVGVCSRLRKDDHVMSGHRSHAHYLAKGGSLQAMLSEIHGKADGCCGGKGGSMHLVDIGAGFLGAVPIVASTLPIATGAALASQMKGEDRVTVVFFGEGATEEGVFHESLHFASLKKLPIVFVCENNLYSVYSPMYVRQPSNRDIAGLGAAHGVESFSADGNDVCAVSELAGAAVEKARVSGGPLFLEFKTYRWREHCGPNYDNDIGYRPEEEFLAWKERCPLKKMETRLRESGLWDGAWAELLENELSAEIEKAFAHAEAAPVPAPDKLFGPLFAE